MASRPLSKPLLVAILVGCIGLTAYTSHKLYTMARIRGVIGERLVVTHSVVDKTREEPVRRRDDPTCWLWYHIGGVRHRIQSDCDYWARVTIGQTIEIVSLEDKSFLKDGEIYASDGNFMFDIVLLGVELAGVVACIVALVRRRRPA